MLPPYRIYVYGTKNSITEIRIKSRALTKQVPFPAVKAERILLFKQ